MFALAKCVLLFSSCGHRDQQSVQDLSPHSLLSCWCPSLFNFSTFQLRAATLHTEVFKLSFTSSHWTTVIFHMASKIQQNVKESVCFWISEQLFLTSFIACTATLQVYMFWWYLSVIAALPKWKFILSCVHCSMRCKFHDLRVYE